MHVAAQVVVLLVLQLQYRYADSIQTVAASVNVTFYLTGGWQGNFLPLQDSAGAYGGLARFATVLRERHDVAFAETGNNDTVTIGVDMGAFFGVSPFSQFAPKQLFYNMLADLGISVFSITATDTFDGLGNYLTNMDALQARQRTSIVLSNAVLNSATSQRLMRVFQPFQFISANNFTIGVLGFVDDGFCGRAPYSCGPGTEQFAGISNADPELIEKTFNLMIQAAPQRPQLIVALLPGIALGFDASPLPMLLIRAGVDVIVVNDGAYQTTAEAIDPTFIPPAALEIVDPTSGRRGIYASGLSDGRAIGKVDLEIGATVILKSTTRLIQLRECINGTRTSSCVVPATDVTVTVSQISTDVSRMIDTTVVGYLSTPIDGGPLSCRFAECGVGDLASDAMRSVIPNCDIAFLNGGGLRSSFAAGNVTERALLTTVPFQDSIASFTLRGTDLLATIRHGLSRVDNITTIPTIAPYPGTGRYLQFSGLRIRYNPMESLEKRLISVEIEVGPGVYSILNSFIAYRCCALVYMMNGGDDYTMLKTNALNRVDTVYTQETVIRTYLAKFPQGLNYTTPTKRIVIDTTAAEFKCSPSCVHGTCTSSFVCNCSTDWTGSDCGTSVPVDSCAVHKARGVTLLSARDAATNFPGGIAAVVVFATLFGAEICLVPFLTQRYAGVVRATSHRGNPGTMSTARWNLQNGVRLGLLCLQAIQLHAIVLNVDLSHGTVITVGGSAFGSIGATYFSGTYFWYFWVIMSVTLLWVFYAIIYIIDGGIFVRRHFIGRVVIYPADQLLQIWVTAGFIPTLLQGLRAFHCWYIGTVAYMAVDSVCDVPCWSGEHWKYVVVAAVTILVYYPLSSISAMLWQDLNDLLDVRHKSHFFIVEPVIKCTLVCLRVFFPHVTVAYLVVITLICASVSAYHLRCTPCFVEWVNVPVAITYVSASLTAIFLLAGVLADNVVVFYGAVVVWFVCTAAIATSLRRYSSPLFFRHLGAGLLDTRARDMLMAMKKVFVATSRISLRRTSMQAKVAPALNDSGNDGDSDDEVLQIVLSAVARDELDATVLSKVRAAISIGHRWPIVIYRASTDDNGFIACLDELFMDLHPTRTVDI